MISTAILLALLLVATVTDLRWRKIFNWTTYPGILLAVVANALASLLGAAGAQLPPAPVGWHGLVGLQASLLGLLCCGGVMVVCYAFFAGGVGGGDVKLVAMMGAFLGLYAGVEAMLWTFVLGGCTALISLIWRYGLVHVVVRSFKYATFWVRLGAHFPLTEQERQPLKTKLFLAPSAVVAVLIVRLRPFDWM